MQKIYYKRKFTQFLKEHNLYDENAMKYLYQNGIFFDYAEEEKRDFMDCYFTTNKRKILKGIILYAPCIESEKTLIINIYLFSFIAETMQTGHRISAKQKLRCSPT